MKAILHSSFNYLTVGPAQPELKAKVEKCVFKEDFDNVSCQASSDVPEQTLPKPKGCAGDLWQSAVTPLGTKTIRWWMNGYTPPNCVITNSRLCHTLLLHNMMGVTTLKVYRCKMMAGQCQKQFLFFAPMAARARGQHWWKFNNISYICIFPKKNF